MAKMYYEKDCDLNYLNGKSFQAAQVDFVSEYFPSVHF